MKRLLIICSLLCACLALAQDDFLIEDIEIIGNRTTRDWVILRELGFSEGDRILIDDLETARNRLLNLQIFNNVFIETNEEGAVVIEVSEQFRYIPLAGLTATDGLAQDAFANPAEFFDIMTAMVGVADLNHRGSGATAELEFRFGATSGFAADYRSRWLSTRIPIGFDFGIRSLIVSDKHASVLDSSRHVRDRRIFMGIGTREGKKARLGARVTLQEIKEEDDPPAEGRTMMTYWFSPFVNLDHRDLEWYPRKGFFAGLSTDVAGGDETFYRSQYELRGYFSLRRGKLSPILAGRLNGATSASDTPAWSHYYFGFTDLLRGYSSQKSEASTVLIGDLELRIPMCRETTYNVPLAGRYGHRIPFWWALVFFGERAQLQLDGTRTDVWAGGAGVHIRVPYVQIVELSWALNRDSKNDFLIEVGTRF